MAKKKSTSKKPDKAQKEDRIREVQQMLIDGLFTKDIITECMGRWNVTDRTVYTYIETAFKEFKELRQKDMESSLARHIETRWMLYKKLLANSTNKRSKRLTTNPKVIAELRALLQDIARLEGLYVEKVDHTTKGKEITGFKYVLPDGANPKANS